MLEICGYNNTAQNRSGFTLWQRTPSYSHQIHPSSQCLEEPCDIKHLEDVLLYFPLKHDLFPKTGKRNTLKLVNFSYIMQHKLLFQHQHIPYLWRCSTEEFPTFPGSFNWPFSKTPLSQVCFMVETTFYPQKKKKKEKSNEALPKSCRFFCSESQMGSYLSMQLCCSESASSESRISSGNES